MQVISPLNCICLRKFLPSSSGNLPLHAVDLPPSIKTCSFTKERYSPSGEESISHLEEAVLQIMTRCTSTQVGTQCRNQRSHDHRDKFLRTYCLSNISIVSDLIRHQILIQQDKRPDRRDFLLKVIEPVKIT